MDRPLAGLIVDLKRGGLLEKTLIVWAGAFGRPPFSQGSDGRDFRLTDVHGRVVQEILA